MMISFDGKEYISWSHQEFPWLRMLTTDYVNFSALKANCGTTEHSGFWFSFFSKFLWYLCNGPRGTNLKQV